MLTVNDAFVHILSDANSRADQVQPTTRQPPSQARLELVVLKLRLQPAAGAAGSSRPGTGVLTAPGSAAPHGPSSMSASAWSSLAPASAM